MSGSEPSGPLVSIFLSVRLNQKLSIDIYLQLKTSFILLDDEVNFLKSIQCCVGEMYKNRVFFTRG